jgi:anti-sigma factor RsiW
VDCSLIEPDLVSFHFGAATDVARNRLEEHLLGCPRCMSAFFALKRAVEDGPSDAEAPRPSAASHARLRQAIADEFVRAPRRTWIWTSAAAAVVLAAALLGFFTHSDKPPAPILPPASAPQNIDSARPEPLSLDFI